MDLKKQLDLRGPDNKDIEAKFKKIAELLFQEYYIKKGDNKYEFLEIEFYYYTKGHEDIITYPRQVEAGKWFFHNSGVDISFESRCKDVKQPSAIRKPGEDYFGGILIRSLLKKNKDDPKYQLITGPLKCTWDLFDVIDALKITSEDLPVITKKEETSIKKVHSTSRYISINDEKANQKFDVNFDDFNLFKKENYRYYIKDECPKWANLKKSDYNGRPW
ncbi:hypothetical protein AGMMS49574_15630 [Bacteroidia bacterium]|nr:hypothetical protein AGMMS49574_15630 [Bacteroidia bacterium]